MNGLQIEGKPLVKRIGCAVTASLHVIEQAREEGIDALVVHHGLYWKRESPLPVGILGKRLRTLIAGEISLLAYHLPMDAHPEIGNNWKAAEELGFQECRPFAGGLGVAGVVPSASIDGWIEKLEGYYHHPVRHAPGGAEEIRRIGLVSGGAHRMIDEAVEAGLDLFITGTADEPTWHIAREGGIHLCAVGHFNSERVGPRALAEWLRQHTSCEILFLDEVNPF